jgi:glycosyltransferase involved in cell wall biosynthesis
VVGRASPIDGEAVRIAVVGVLASSLLGLRGEMMRAMAEAGHQVDAMAPEADPVVRSTLRSMGIRYTPVPMARTGMNPLKDGLLVWSLIALFRRRRVDAVFVYAAKPVVYGLIAARVARVPFRTAMITGSGSALAGGGSPRRHLVSWLLRGLYRIALRQAHVVFFHNPDDQRTFERLGLVGSRQRLVRLHGSGVDLVHFSPRPLPPCPVTFLMMARLIKDKGVCEYADAARIVRQRFPEARFLLLGPTDSNPTAIPRSLVDAWEEEGAIEYVGAVADVRPFLADAHVCVLPSYGEGLPRSIVEAMAMGRAVITTDVPGCRETVVEGRNGILVPPRDANALARAMCRLIAEPDRLSAMGIEGRSLAEERYDVHQVNRVILSAMGL